jgi:ribosomal protein S18 acetylase RimI-like enzyme
MAAAPRLRPARRSDLATLVRFQLACAFDSEGMRLDPAACRRGVAALLRRPSLGRYYVWEDGGEPRACLLIQREWSDWSDGAVWWIHSVYVAPERRRQGVYERMYREIQRLARADKKVRGLRLYVDLKNRAAQAAYEKLGMSGEHYRLYEWMIPR